MDPNFHLRNALVHDVEEMCSRLGVPDAVLVSGDVAFAGHKEEYDFGLSWLEELCRRSRTTLSSIFICPGNHDVVRTVANGSLVQTIHRDIKASSSLSLESLLRGLLNDPPAAQALYQSIAPYNFFAVQFFCDLSPPDRTVAKRDLVMNDGSILRLWGLNSTFVSSEADIKGDLFVDPAYGQITHQSGIEHLVMCHHPLGWLRQEGALRDHLNDVARIHLFGHEHTNRIEMARDWIRLAASAAHPDRTEPGWEPGYNLIELAVQGTGIDRNLSACVHVRVWQTAPGRFRPKLDRDGSEVFRHTIRLDGWEPAQPATADKQNVLRGEDLLIANDDAGSDPMSTLRDISVRFFKLTLSQKSAIAGKLGLLEDEDVNQPDFERFRRIFVRARERNLIERLENEITTIENAS